MRPAAAGDRPDEERRPSANILDLATLTNTYFEIGQTTQPALDAFKKDWLKVKQLADCT